MTNFPHSQLIGGIDEAGRGPLAGPVTAAAVVFMPGYQNSDIGDSKQLTEDQRETLFDEIVKNALAFQVISVGPRRIDQINIREATKLAMQLAGQKVQLKLREMVRPDGLHFLVDGNMHLGNVFSNEAMIKGDEREMSIGAASILAKVTRDRVMQVLAKRYPVYGFAKHKGYPTPAHKQLVKLHGPTPVHRRTFAGVKEFYESFQLVD